MRFIVTLFWIMLLAIEWHYWLKWHSGYFRFGLPILKMKIPSTNKHIPVIKSIVSSDEISEVNIGKLSLRKLSEREVAIRNKHFLLWPIRGRLILNSDHSVLKIQIFIDWFMIILYLYFVTILVLAEGGPRHPFADTLGLIGGSIAFYIILIERYLVFIKRNGDL